MKIHMYTLSLYLPTSKLTFYIYSYIFSMLVAYKPRPRDTIHKGATSRQGMIKFLTP